MRSDAAPDSRSGNLPEWSTRLFRRAVGTHLDSVADMLLTAVGGHDNHHDDSEQDLERR